MSAVVEDNVATIAVGAHDTTYLIDFAEAKIPLGDAKKGDKDVIAEEVITKIQKYEEDNFFKFIGAGLPETLRDISPSLCSRLWLELDIIPIVMRPEGSVKDNCFWESKKVDEQADSMGRKCIMHFGPSLTPLLHVGFRGTVETDASFRAFLTTLENHRGTCSKPTWNSMMHYAQKLKANNIRIAFFSSTPQGGGVALMRHALVRFSRLAGVDLTWYGMYFAFGFVFTVLKFYLEVLPDSLTLHSAEASTWRVPCYEEHPQHSSGCSGTGKFHFERRKGTHLELDYRECRALLAMPRRAFETRGRRRRTRGCGQSMFCLLLSS